MALTIKIGDQPEGEEQEAPEHDPIPIRLNIRKTVDGDILIFDHPDVDITILPKKRKVVVFPKVRVSDEIYDVQDRFFKALFARGAIKQDSVQGGNVYGSMEASYPDSEEVNVLQALILAISKFVEEEKKFVEFDDQVEKEWEEGLLDPDDEDSTELGEVPQSIQKGSVRPGYIYSPYGISSVYRYE
tara:strand:- start:346 stop:906 length:561 start_codon:yes stop_codon:yes gene_type:complete